MNEYVHPVKTMDDPEELLDLVDSQDQPIGVIKREEVLQLEANKRGFVRGALVFLVNDKAELWIPRRNKDKKIAPGGLDASVAEHVGHGETYEAASVRGLEEELNVTAHVSDLEYIGTLSPFPIVPYFCKVFVYHTNREPVYGSDFTGFEWLAPSQLVERLQNGEPAKDNLLPSVQLLLDNPMFSESKEGVSQ